MSEIVVGVIGATAHSYVTQLTDYSFEISKLVDHLINHAGGIMKARRPILIFALGLTVTVCSFGAEKFDGQKLYRENCKVCHDKGSQNGEYSPLTLVQDQWRRFFKEKLVPSHKEVMTKDNKKVLDTLSPEQFKAIEKFCVDHAADSEQPATCG